MTRSMYFKLFFAGVLLGIFGEPSVTDRLKTDGDVTVMGLFEIFENEAGLCSRQISIQSVMAAEAVKWYFNQLNTVGKMPVKIAFEVQKTCKLPHVASEAAIGIISDVLSHTSNKTVIGVIGPEYSSEAINVSRIFSSVNELDRLVQVGFSTTAAILGDVSAFPNFVRVIPNDNVQIEVMIQAMQTMRWNRIAIIHESDVYGREGALMLKARAEENGICVPLLLEVNTENMRYIIHDVISPNRDVTAVVYFGSTTSMFTTVQQDGFNNNPVIMLSEGINLNKDIFKKKNGGFVHIGKGSYTVTPAYRDVAEFQGHWNSIFNNKTTFEKELFTNPWLYDVYRDITNCVTQECPFFPSDTSATASVDEQPLYIQYAIIAAHALAKSIKLIHSRICGIQNGLCEEFVERFRQGHVIEEMKNNMYLYFETDFVWTPTGFHEVVLHINSSGELNVLPGQVLYELYHLQSVNKSEFRFVEIGEYINGRMNISLEKIRDLDISGKSVSWPNVRKGQCPIHSKCMDCLSFTSSINDYIIDQGDAYVIATLPIFAKSGLQDCGDIRTQNSYQLIEAIRYAIEYVNNGFPDQSVQFSKLHIGLIVFNSCNSGAVIDRKIYNLHRNGIRLQNGTTINISDKIIGYIGDVSSQVSLAVADTLTKLDQVQISIASTSTLLSDRDKYPNFMRVVTPDHEQAKTIVAILKELGFSYVQLIYSEDAYGENGRDHIKEAARANGICVVQEIYVRESDNFHKFYEELRIRPHARAVIVFLSSNLHKFVSTLTGQMQREEFTFIGSETWGKNSLLMNDLTVGSISVSLEMSIDKEFEDRVRRLQPKPYNEDPWSMKYLQKKYSCYFSDSFDKSQDAKCQVQRNVTSRYESDTWSAAAIVATRSLLYGTKSLLDKKCGTSASSLCHDFLIDKKGLVEEIKRSATIIEDGVEIKVFNNNGDGNRGYKIYQIQKGNGIGEMFYKEIGQYSLDGHFIFDGQSTYVSSCPNDKACNECLGQNQEITKDSDSTMKPQWIVLLGLLVVCVVTIIVLSLVIRYLKINRHKDVVSSPYITVAYGDENKPPTTNADTYPTPVPCNTDYSDIKLEVIKNDESRVKTILGDNIVHPHVSQQAILGDNVVCTQATQQTTIPGDNIVRM